MGKKKSGNYLITFFEKKNVKVLKFNFFFLKKIKLQRKYLVKIISSIGDEREGNFLTVNHSCVPSLCRFKLYDI